MKTNREPSLAATKITYSLPAFHRPKRQRGALVALALLLGALQLPPFGSTALAESSTVGKSGGDPTRSVQVDRVDRGDVGLEPSFGTAIYENLLEELAKTGQFKQLFRSGDRDANDVPSLLILKITVQKYTPGSETRRAVTTVNGATKLNVRIQLVTREGHVMLEKVVDGNVRFIGGNLRATHNLAHNVAATLKRSTLPEQARTGPRTGSRKNVQVKRGEYGRDIPNHPNRFERGEGNRNTAEEKST
jgi:hypothetical protein